MKEFNPQFPADLVKLTEEILNEQLNFLCSDNNTAICSQQEQDLNYRNCQSIKVLRNFQLCLL